MKMKATRGNYINNEILTRHISRMIWKHASANITMTETHHPILLDITMSNRAAMMKQQQLIST